MIIEDIIKKYEWVYHDIIYKYNYDKIAKYNNHFDIEDLENYGRIGLWKAVEKYNPDRASFSTFAYKKVKSEIFRGLRSLTNFKRKEIIEFKKEYGNYPNFFSIDELNKNENSFKDLIFQNDYPAVEIKDELNYHLSKLNEKERSIVIDFYINHLTLTKIGKKHNCTKANISLIVKSAFEKMNHKYFKKPISHNNKISQEIKDQIYKLYRTHSVSKIAQILEINRSTVYKTLRPTAKANSERSTKHSDWS